MHLLPPLFPSYTRNTNAYWNYYWKPIFTNIIHTRLVLTIKKKNVLKLVPTFRVLADCSFNVVKSSLWRISDFNRDMYIKWITDITAMEMVKSRPITKHRYSNTIYILYYTYKYIVMWTWGKRLATRRRLRIERSRLERTKEDGTRCKREQKNGYGASRSSRTNIWV